jgi:hypothetical protein
MAVILKISIYGRHFRQIMLGTGFPDRFGDDIMDRVAIPWTDSFKK